MKLIPHLVRTRLRDRRFVIVSLLILLSLVSASGLALQSVNASGLSLRERASTQAAQLLARTTPGRAMLAAFFATQTVTSGANSGAGTLRDTIAAASAGDTIVFSGVTTVTLTSGELGISKNLTIDGGAGVTVTRGSGTFRIFNISSGTVELKNLTVTNGNPASQAGGIQNNGTLTMTDCTISNNTAPQAGGIQNDGTLTMTDCTVSNNSGSNLGGGIVIYGSSTTLTRCNISNNAGGSGGGISLESSGQMTLTNCTLSGNTNSGSNVGGGILFNSSQNTTLTNCTITNNQHDGIWIGSTGNVTLINTIVLGNTLSGTPTDIKRPSSPQGNTTASSFNNLIGTGGSGSLTNGSNGNQVGVSVANALLGTLGNYGGSTQTINLLPGSPAINAGTNTGAPSTDQRGIARPQQTTTDIGAFESQGFTVAINSGDMQSATTTTAFTNPLSVTVSSSAGEPVNGGKVTFTPPGSGASATVAGSPATISGGVATSGTVTANGTVGANYNVKASVSTTEFVNFTLSNTTLPMPTLGNYSAASVNLAQQTTVTPDAAPTNATSIVATASSGFNGTLRVNPATGVVSVVNAHPAGTYTITVNAFNISGVTTTTFQLTVQNGTACAGTPAFTSAANVTGVSTPLGTAVGDFNNDGKQDLATANGSNATASIRLGDGAGGFTVMPTVSTPANPNAVAVGDFNGDGNQDIAVSSSNNAVAIRLGDGAGGFSGSTDITTGQTTKSIALGDFNNDGKLDFVTANIGGDNATVALGNGAGGFPTVSNVSVGDGPGQVVVADFNSDGNLDFATSNQIFNPPGGFGSPGTVTVRIGNGDGTFTNGPSYNVGDNPEYLAVGDFNEDGKPDLITSNQNSASLSLILGDVSNTVTPPTPTTISVSSGPGEIRVADINNDGHQDVAFKRSGLENFAYLLGTGTGSFGTAVIVTVTGAAGTKLAVGDFNGDGRQDFVTANFGTDTLFVRLGGCDPAPTITAGATITRQQGSAGTSDTIATVTDNSGNSTVTVTAMTVPTGIFVTSILNPNGTVTATVRADCSAALGDNTVVLKATDSVGGTATANLTVKVTANTPPSVTYGSVSVVSGGATTNSPTTATDNGTITGYSVFDKGTYTGTISVNSSGVVSISSPAPAGTHTITIRATDDCSATTDAQFSLTVTAPSLAVSKSHSGNFTQGQTNSWTIQVTNTGTSSTSGTTTVSDTLPTGYTLSSFSGTGWSCSGTTTVTCTSSQVVAGMGGAFNALTLTVNVPANSPTSVSNTAMAYGGGDPVRINLGTAVASNADTVTVQQVAASITATGGTPQSTTVNTSFATALAATVRDAANVVIPNVTVNFSAPGGGATASLSGPTANTDGSGVASVTATANAVAGGPYNVTASVGALSATFSLTNTPGPATSFLVTAPANASVGTAFNFTVTALDSFGNTATGYTGTAQFTSTDGAATLPANYTFLAGDNGVRMLSATLNTVGMWTITAKDTVTTSITGTSGNINVSLLTCPTTLTVNNTGDDVDINPGNGICETANGNGICTLRAAIQEANALVTPTLCSPLTINFNVTLPNTIMLGSDLPTIAHPNLTITGPGANQLTVSGASMYRPFNIGSGNYAVTISGLTVANGRGNGGGGLINFSTGQVNLDNMTFDSNAITGSSGGGGIRHASGGTLNVTGSTFLNNNSTGTGGGGINNFSTSGIVNVTNCTFSGNLANLGGGIHNHSTGTTNVTNCTLVSNGGGVNNNSGTVTVKNTIAVGNGTDINGTVTASNNLTGALATALLSTLGNYGGTTQTFALLPGSPAINAGTASGAPATDQRGIARPQQSVVDIGAFESRGFTLAINSGNNQSTAVTSAFANPLQVTVTSSNSEPVDGGQITFTPPGSGASATIAGNPATIASGVATTGTVTANTIKGGPYTVSAAANGASTAVNFSLTNSCATIMVSNPATTTGTAGTFFSQTFTQMGGITPVAFSTSSTLPTGLTLNSNGTLSGTPTQTGTFPIAVNVTDNNNCMVAGGTYTLVIGCQTISVTNPGTTSGTAGSFFSQSFMQSGGIGTTTFSTSSTLPTGLTLASNGTLSGTPTQTGSFPITVKATDSNGCMGTGATYTLVIGCQTITVTNPTITTGTSGTAFNQTFTQSGGIGTVAFTTSSTLPTGLTLASNGVLSGTPTQLGAFPITVVATDANSCTGMGTTYNLVITCGTITITPPATTNLTLNEAFNQSFTQTGAVGTATYMLNSGTLPLGLTLASNGTLSGTPTETGSFSITVKVTDSLNCTGTSNTYKFTVNAPNTFPFSVNLSDPIVCTGENNILSVHAEVMNPNNVAANLNFNAAFSAQLTGVPGTCQSSVGTCTINNGGVTVTGVLPANQTVLIDYKVKVTDGTPIGTQLCVNSTASLNGGNPAMVQACTVLNCPLAPANVQAGAQKAGSVLVFPYYISKAAPRKDTRLTLSNIGLQSAYVHIFFIDGASCDAADQFVCLTPNASFSFKASEYDPDTTGWLLAVAVNSEGIPVQNNSLIGNAFIMDGDYVDNYGAEAFWAHSQALAIVQNQTATLFFDGRSYDAAPSQIAAEIQSPVDVANQRVVTVGLQGDLTTGQMSGASQVGVGQVFNGNEKPFGSFSSFLVGKCQAIANITTTVPRVPNGMNVMIPSGQVGSLKFNIGAGVGLLMTPRTAPWRGIRALHKTAQTISTLTIPVIRPVC